MTQFATKAISLQDWMLARASDTFVPMYYSADHVFILAAVTWILLRQGKLTLFSKFKVISTMEYDRGEFEHSLPSWVIDWPVASRHFRRRSEQDETSLDH